MELNLRNNYSIEVHEQDNSEVIVVAFGGFF